MTTPIQELLIERGGSYDLSAKLRAWHDARVRPVHTFSRLSRDFPLDESIVVDWSLPRDRRRHRDVPANRIPRLAELLGVTVEALLDGVELPLEPSLPATQLRELLPTQVAPVRPVLRTFDVFCLLCARGVGRGGIRCFVHQLPRQLRCVTCGGVMLAEDLSGGTRLREEHATVSRRLLDDATLERAAR